MFKHRYITHFTHDFVKEMLQLHDVHCIFELDAPMQIFNRLMAAGLYTSNDLDSYQSLIKYKECFKLSEIYCPHEGIDRRSEYGMETV